MIKLTADESLGVLHAWQTVRSAGWPQLCAAMTGRSAAWRAMTEAQLEREVRGYLDEMNQPSCNARVFWKRAPEYRYLGCNNVFARDGGMPEGNALDGLDDFSSKLSWSQQAGKYRADDERVVASGVPLLDILERQTQPTSVVYVQTNKAPLLRGGAGAPFGVLGMYEVLDEAAARRKFHAKMRASGY